MHVSFEIKKARRKKFFYYKHYKPSEYGPWHEYLLQIWPFEILFMKFK